MTLQNELNILKSIKFLKNIVKININRNFIVKNNLKIKNSGPIDSSTTHKLKQLLFQNNSACDNAVKNFISKTATMAEAIKISKEKFSVFFSKPSETKNSNSNNSNHNKSDITNNLAILAKFENLNALKLFCSNTIKTYEKIWLTSELYKLHNSALILMLCTKKETESSLSALLSEFNATIEKGKFQEAIAREHCIKILKKHAIEKISLIN